MAIRVLSVRLGLANAIENSGIERGKAKRIASVIVDLIHDTVAANADVQVVEMPLKADVQAVATRLIARVEQVERADGNPTTSDEMVGRVFGYPTAARLTMWALTLPTFMTVMPSG